MRECYGCFKPARDPTACISCSYVNSQEIIQNLIKDLPPELRNLPDNIIEEARYELMCKLPQFKAEEAHKIMESGLATIISKFADTAIYLPKKRNEDMDDMKIILFNSEGGECFVTNGDVVIHLTDIPAQVLDGLNTDIQAYDYLSERFIPNPLPYGYNELNQPFFNDFCYSITIPVTHMLDCIHSRYPTALDRRGTLAVIDVGYGIFAGSFVVPKFSEDPKTKKKFFSHSSLFGGKPIILDKASVIGDAGIDPDTPYICMVTYEVDEFVAVNAYKRYGNYVTFGMFKIMSPALSDDISPFDLESYADMDKITFPIESEINNRSSNLSMASAFIGFRPIVIETEYLFHVLLMMGTFGYNYMSMRVRYSPSDPIMFEGIKEVPDQPTLEAVMATMEIGQNGQKCEDGLGVMHL